MIDMNRATQIMKEHFDKITSDEFMENVEKYCPELLEPSSENETKPSRTEEALSVLELPYDTYCRIEKIAHSQGMTPRTLIEDWITKYSQQEKFAALRLENEKVLTV